MKTALTNEKNKGFGKLKSAVIKGAGKTLDSLEEASQRLEPLAKMPIIGSSIVDVQDLLSMLNDYLHGRYKKLPVTVLLGSAAIIAYLISPFDLVPDNIPILGFVDDAFIINVVMELCITQELDRYRKWRREK